MARQKKEKIEKTIQMGHDELETAVDRFLGQKESGASYGQTAARIRREFCERTNYNPTVFGWIALLKKMDDGVKRQAMVREFLMGLDLMDWDEQGELFGSIKGEIDARVKKEVKEEDRDLRPAFMQNAMPLEKAEKAFEKAKAKADDEKPSARKAPKGSPLSDESVH